MISREFKGAKEIKRYDKPTTPYQRLLAIEQLTEAQRTQLFEQYQSISPLKLQREIGEAIEKLWKMETPDPASERARLLRERVKEAQSK